MKTEILFIVVLLMTVLGATASYFLKKASSQNKIIVMLKKHDIYIGGVLYVIAALLNVYVLHYLDYSIVLPLTSITYIWTLLIAHQFLKERITKKKVFGVLLIIAGVSILLM